MKIRLDFIGDFSSFFLKIIFLFNIEVKIDVLGQFL